MRVAPSWLYKQSHIQQLRMELIVLLNSLNSKNLKYEIRAKNRENPREIDKNLMKMRCCVTPCGQTDVGSSQKNISCLFAYFYTSALIQTFHKKVFVFFFFGFIQRKILLSCENIFSLAMLSAIIYHIRSN